MKRIDQGSETLKSALKPAQAFASDQHSTKAVALPNEEDASRTRDPKEHERDYTNSDASKHLLLQTRATFFVNFPICAQAFEKNDRITLHGLCYLACSRAFCVCLPSETFFCEQLCESSFSERMNCAGIHVATRHFVCIGLMSVASV